MSQSSSPPSTNRWFHRHPKKTLLAITMLSLLLLLGFAELGVRWIFPQWAPTRAERVEFWKYDSLLGWSHQPYQTGPFVHPDFSIEVQINSQGLRDREYSWTRTANQRMLVLGDSFGWGYGVAQSDIFSEVLEKHLSNWEVINASVSGYGTDQEFLYLRERGKDYRPDWVLLLFYENDFRNNLSREEYWYNKPYFKMTATGLQLHHQPVPTATVKQRLERLIYGRTYLFAKLLEGVKRWRFEESKPPGGNQLKSATLPVTVTLELLKALQTLSRQIKAQLVLVSVPMPTEQRQVLQTFSDQEKIPYLPLDENFSKVTEPLTFLHDKHWNANGHAVAASAIEEWLREIVARKLD